MGALLEVQLILKVECPSLRFMEIPWHIPKTKKQKKNK